MLSVRIEAPDPDLWLVSAPDSRRCLRAAVRTIPTEAGNFSAVLECGGIAALVARERLLSQSAAGEGGRHGLAPLVLPPSAGDGAVPKRGACRRYKGFPWLHLASKAAVPNGGRRHRYAVARFRVSIFVTLYLQTCGNAPPLRRAHPSHRDGTRRFSSSGQLRTTTTCGEVRASVVCLIIRNRPSAATSYDQG